MTDFDEDGPASSAPYQQADNDLTDETQDFRFLTNLSLTTEQSSLPRRGEKDFESHGTTAQQDALSKSRTAMHDALSYPRIHAPKYLISATYNPDGGRTLVENPRGQHFRTMGKAETDARLYLLPEEALYLVERGNLYLRWPIGYREDEDDEMPFSLQSAYAILVGNLGLTLERYTVYSGLKRSGYVVNRAPTWYPRDWNTGEVFPEQRSQVKSGSGFTWLYDLLRLRGAREPSPLGPLIGTGFYRNYKDIYTSLNLIPFHDPSDTISGSSPPNDDETLRQEEHEHLRCSFYVWKPRPDFKKSSPGPPDFRIAVVNVRDDNVPNLEQLDGLLQSVPYEPPPPRMSTQLYPKLKHGWRNVILAIVDQGVVSYLRVSDMAFGKEKMYERASKGRGGKRGGGRGRGGRGRGGRGQ